MQRILLFVSVAAFTVLAAVHLAGAENQVVFGEVTSAALGRKLPVAVVVPALTANPPVPVLFFLHGRGRNHRTLLESPTARSALMSAPFYVVLPQGEDGWYVDSPARPADRYGTYLEEVVAWAEKAYPLARDREHRGIAGWSMGGYGAMRFAQTHPRQIGFVGSIIGLLDFPRTETLAEGQNYPVPVPRFTADPAVWRQYNPLGAVDALRGTSITLVLASRGFERTMNENFLAALAARNLPVRVHRLEGGHEFPLVERAVPLVLTDAGAFFHARQNPP